MLQWEMASIACHATDTSVMHDLFSYAYHHCTTQRSSIATTAELHCSLHIVVLNNPSLKACPGGSRYTAAGCVALQVDHVLRAATIPLQSRTSSRAVGGVALIAVPLFGAGSAALTRATRHPCSDNVACADGGSWPERVAP